MDAKDLPLYLTVRDVAKLMGFNLNKTYDMVREGKIPHIKEGARITIPRDAFLEHTKRLALSNMRLDNNDARAV